MKQEDVIRHDGQQEFQGETADLAEQLLSLRQPPGPQLRARIQAIPTQPAPRFWSAWLRRPRLAWVAAGLLLVGLLLATPAATATLGNIETMIGHIRLMMLDVYPEPTAPLVVESVPVSLAEAQAAVPFDFQPPAYLPESLDEGYEVFLTPLEVPLVKLRWRDSAGGFTQLTAYAHPDAQAKTLVGLEEGEPVDLDGRTAVLVRGAWDEASRTWNADSGVVTLIWAADGVQYRLLSYSDTVSVEALIKMAESVQRE